MEERSTRDQILRRWQALKTERSSWMPHWREISELILPRSGRYFVQDRNRGGAHKYNKINDSTATRSLRILAAGMLSGATSPARPWFRLTTSVPDLDESADVKRWLADVTRMMQMVFARSNTYRALHMMYEEMGAFGTAASVLAYDWQNVIHHHVLTAGEYAIATDHRGFVDTLYREFQMTPAQMVQQFGDNVSPTVKRLYEKGIYDDWVTVIHAIEPRRDRDTRKKDNLNMPWRSVYLEEGGEEGSLLSESGFDMFPAMCPRWAVTGGDIYGNSPAMEALGDIKQLRQETLRKAQCIDYQTKPPLQAPTALKDREIELLPGGVTYVDAANPTGGVRSMFDVRLDLGALMQDMEQVKKQIGECFYADLFLMLANSRNPQMTATEVAERHEEKLLMLGPVVERMHNELLDPLIRLTFRHMVNAGIVPEPPDEIKGVDMAVEFVSMLAQAQRSISTNSVDRFIGSMGAIAGMKPEVLDKLNVDVWTDEYADMLGVSPNMILSEDEVAQIREARAQAQAQAEQAAALQQGAQVAGDLGKIKTDKPNALTDVLSGLTGYSGGIGEGL